MAVVVYCPSCQSKIRAQDNVMGRQIKCPRCNSMFAVTGSTGADAASYPQGGEYQGEGSPFGQLDNQAAPAGGRYAAPSNRSVQPRSSSAFVDFLLFRRMITPFFIQVFFWLGVIGCLIGAGVAVVSGIIGFSATKEPLAAIVPLLSALVTLFVGPIVLRIYCEILILFFRMNDVLREIQNNTENLRGPG